MSRVSKEPDVRKAELVDAAETLFIEKGFNETAVSDVVKAANVAQGTFYYYFKTKDDILDAVIDKNIEEVRVLTEKVMDLPGLSAIERIAAYSGAFREWTQVHGKIVVEIHEKKNEVLHYRMSRRVLEYMVPAYQRMIEQGVAEGTFHTDYPLEAAKAVLAMSESILDGVHTLADLEDPANKKKAKALIVFTERVLGMEPGLFMELIGKNGVML